MPITPPDRWNVPLSAQQRITTVVRLVNSILLHNSVHLMYKENVPWRLRLQKHYLEKKKASPFTCIFSLGHADIWSVSVQLRTKFFIKKELQINTGTRVVQRLIKTQKTMALRTLQPRFYNLIFTLTSEGKTNHYKCLPPVLTIWTASLLTLAKLTAHNWQKWNRTLLTCPCNGSTALNHSTNGVVVDSPGKKQTRV